MNQNELLRKVAELEFINDQLFAEMSCLDHLLRRLGFQEGLETVKLSAQELLGCDIQEDYSVQS